MQKTCEQVEFKDGEYEEYFQTLYNYYIGREKPIMNRSVWIKVTKLSIRRCELDIEAGVKQFSNAMHYKCMYCILAKCCNTCKVAKLCKSRLSMTVRVVMNRLIKLLKQLEE